MKIINPSVKVEFEDDFNLLREKIEQIARTCYQSEPRDGLWGRLINKGHWPMFDHRIISMRVVCDRGVSHEIVRHRIAAYAQESTRYCNYSKDKFGNEITVIKPCFWAEDSIKYKIWKHSCLQDENDYFELLSHGASPQEARSVLPSSLKTEIVMTLDLTAWRHFFKMRVSNAAHPQMREIAVPILKLFQEKIPLLFDNCLN